MTENELAELRFLLRKDFAIRKAEERSNKFQSSCNGKHQFATHQEAENTLSRRLAKETKPYRCKLCGKWHIGARQVDRRKSLLKKTKEAYGAPR